MPPVTLILCLVLMSGISSAQNTTIGVDFDNAPRMNNKFTITVPRVDAVVFRSSQIISRNVECVETSPTTCTLDLITNPRDTYILDLDGPFNGTMRTKVTVNVIENYTVACSQYVFPVPLNVTLGTGSFSCVPVFVNPPTGPVDIIHWYKSNFTDGFNAQLVNESRVVYSEINGVTNAAVNFTSAATSDAGYYFPVTGDVDPSDLGHVFPITVAYEPVITSSIEEFSDDLYLNPSVPANRSFSCLLHSFPMATVQWRYTREPVLDPTMQTPTNVSLPCSNCPNVIFEIEPNNGTDEVNYRITIVGVTFDDSGIYTCVPLNDAFQIEFQPMVSGMINAHSYRLRVKHHLRQLWPAVGTIGVMILVAISISLGSLYDYCVGKRKEDEPPIDSQRTMSVTSNSSVDGQLSAGHMALRRLSSARVQLLEEPR